MSTRTVARQCTLCEAHCGILVTVEDEQVTRIEGDPDDVLSKGYICPKAAALADLHVDPERLRRPLRKVGDGFEEVSWEEAFRTIGRELRRIRSRHGRNAVAMYLGNPAAHSPSVMYAIALRVLLGTRWFYSASSIDQFPQEYAAWRMFGSFALVPIADIDRTDRLVVLGANPAVSNGSLSTMPDARGRIRAVRERGGSVVVVDPRRTETARLADEHVAVRPGGDPWLLLGMLHVLFELGIPRPSHLPLAGWEELAAIAATCPPELAAEHAGVDAATIRRLAEEHAAAPSALIYARIGVCHQVTGTITHWLVNAINAVTGNLDRPGGGMFTTPPIDAVAVLRHLAPDAVRWTNRSGEHDSFRFELPVAGMADDLLGGDEDDRIRALITYAGNPVLSTAHGDRLDEALDGLEFMVSIDLYVTETSRHADIILPPMSHLEREEFDFLFPIFSVRNNARYNARVFEPADGAMEDWELLARIILELVPMPVRQLTGPVARRVVDELSPMRLTSLATAAGPHGILRKGPGGLTMRRIRRTAGGVDLGPLQPRLRRLLTTPDKRVQLAPEEFVTELRRLLADGPDDAGRSEEYDLRLIGRRHLRSNNSWLHNVSRMVKGRDRCTVLIHPDDAADRGLVEGDRATVRSAHGTIEVPVEISDEIRLGTVAVPHGWGHDVKGVGWSTAQAHAGVNVNALHDPSLTDHFSGNEAVNGTWVSVARAAVAATVGA